MKLPTDDLSGIFGTSRYPLIYLNIPKCACTTIKNVMYYLDHDAFYAVPEDVHQAITSGSALISTHKSVEELRDALKKKKIAFTFVRHPLSRAYSCFNEKIYDKSPYSFKSIRIWLRSHYKMKLPENPRAVSIETYSLEEHRMNFAKFLSFVHDNIKGKTPVRLDAHWMPQKKILDKLFHVTSIDLIGRVEYFKRDMEYVLGCIGVYELNLLNSKFNEGPAAPYSLRQIIDDEVIELAERAYKGDYETLGYGTNPLGINKNPAEEDIISVFRLMKRKKMQVHCS